MIGTLVFQNWIARPVSGCAKCHVVFIRTVATIVYSVAKLVPGYTLVVRALEPSFCVALEVHCKKTNKLRFARKEI